MSPKRPLADNQMLNVRSKNMTLQKLETVLALLWNIEENLARWESIRK